MQVLRTPDAAFDNLPGWGWEPSYFTSTLFGAEVRIAFYDLGDPSAAETILLPHGEPSWSYLNRKLIPPLLEAGHRVVLFDQVGFGRSDKPVKEEDYSYERHVAWNEDLLINHLDLRGVTALLQDWGGLLGLRVVATHPERFRRLCLANTFLPTCDDSFFAVNEGFYGWKTFAASSKLAGDRLASMMIRGTAGPSAGLEGAISKAEAAAYGAPYPTDEYKAGARVFPELVPTPPSDPTGRPQLHGGEENKAAWKVLEALQIPVLTAFGDNDPVMAGCDKIWQERCVGAKGQPHCLIKGAGHFVQDGGSEQLAEVLLAFVAASHGAASL